MAVYMKKVERLKTNFVKVFGDTPTNRLWDFLILSRRLFDYSMTDVSEATGIAWNTLKELFPHFVRDGIVIKTRKIGRATMYKLNEKHPKAVFMIEIHKAISMVFVRGINFKIELKIMEKAPAHKESASMSIDKSALEPISC